MAVGLDASGLSHDNGPKSNWKGQRLPLWIGIGTRNTQGDATISVVIVQHYPGTVNQYVTATKVSLANARLVIPDRCPHPECRTAHSLIRWGSYQRWALTPGYNYRLRIQRLRCRVCGRTHSLLPDFLHPYRHYVIDLLQRVVSLYLLIGLSLTRLMRRLSDSGPARSTVREWIESFAYGAGELLLDRLLRYLLALCPASELPDSSPEHLGRVPDPIKRRRLQRAYLFWLLAERLYALAKNRLPQLHFAAAQLFPFLLHWLHSQALPPRLFWSPRLSRTPVVPF
jgi:hypothetical protein